MTVLIGDGIRILDGRILVGGENRPVQIEPNIRKTYVELSPPTLEDQTDDLTRIRRALGPEIKAECGDTDIEILQGMSRLLRKADYKVTVVTSGGKITGIEAGDTTAALYGIAFDIGTTTVVGTLMNLATGHELSHASRLNAQVVFGEDTISRIKHVIDKPGGGAEMRGKILDVVNEIVKEAAMTAGIDPLNIDEAVIVGNTTMSHLLLGLDPTGLSQIPFVSVASAAVNLSAAEAGIDINPRGNIYVLPNIAGFVGSDTVGVMLACDYLEPGPALLAVDVGTNGELALRRDGELMVCSTAAGPALEGAELSCGMRAAAGAIEHFRITAGAVECDVIGGVKATGLCGSGIIDVIAELLDAGIVDSYGAIIERDDLKGKVPDSLLERIITVNDQPAFLIGKAENGNSGSRDVVMTQKDIRQIQLAKGAIRAGIQLIVKQMSLDVAELDELLLAGAFGNYIDKVSAQRIGLLPPISPERIRFVGNAASIGAKMALLSRSVRSDAEKILKKARHLELATLPEFMNELSDNMLFP